MTSVPLNFTVSDFDIYIGLGRHYAGYQSAEVYSNGNHQVPVVIKLKAKPSTDDAKLSAKAFDSAIYLCFHNNGDRLSGGVESSSEKTKFCQVLNGAFTPPDGKKHNSDYDIGKTQESYWEDNGAYYFQRYVTVSHGTGRGSEKISCSIATMEAENPSPTAVTAAANRGSTKSGQTWTDPHYITLNKVIPVDYTLPSNLEVMSNKHIRYFKEQYKENLWKSIDDFYVVPHAAHLMMWWQADRGAANSWVKDSSENGISSVASCYIVPKGYSADLSAAEKPLVRRFIEKTVERDLAKISTTYSGDEESLNIVNGAADMIWYNRSGNFDTTLFFIDREHYGVWSGSIHLWYHDSVPIRGDIHNYYKYYIPAADAAHHHWDDTLVDGAIRLSACNHRYPRAELSMYDDITTKYKINIHVKDNYGNSGTITVSTVTDSNDYHTWPRLSVNGSLTL